MVRASPAEFEREARGEEGVHRDSLRVEGPRGNAVPREPPDGGGRAPRGILLPPRRTPAGGRAGGRVPPCVRAVETGRRPGSLFALRASVARYGDASKNFVCGPGRAAARLASGPFSMLSRMSFSQSSNVRTFAS